jgi:hypothetical protein
MAMAISKWQTWLNSRRRKDRNCGANSTHHRHLSNIRLAYCRSGQDHGAVFRVVVVWWSMALFNPRHHCLTGQDGWMAAGMRIAELAQLFTADATPATLPGA